jgi:hypothetical protein
MFKVIALGQSYIHSLMFLDVVSINDKVIGYNLLRFLFLKLVQTDKNCQHSLVSLVVFCKQKVFIRCKMPDI